jgi:hypothetical protein
MAVRPPADYSTELLYCTFYLVFKEPSGSPFDSSARGVAVVRGTLRDYRSLTDLSSPAAVLTGRFPLEFSGVPGLLGWKRW